jgi:predicted nucleic acid-binding protein
MAPIRQEVLSGIRDESTFLAIQERLSDFAYLEILAEDYDCAARFFNACRTRGIAATHVDMLICSVAHRHDVPLFTTDGDFPDYAKCVPLRLYDLANQG